MTKMNREDIIRMAMEAEFDELTFDNWTAFTHNIERFAALVAAAEREACAKVCEPTSPRPCDCDFCDCGNSGDRAAAADWDASSALAIAIRARGETQ